MLRMLVSYGTRNYKHIDPAFYRKQLVHMPWEVIELEQTADRSWKVFRDLISLNSRIEYVDIQCHG